MSVSQGVMRMLSLELDGELSAADRQALEIRASDPEVARERRRMRAMSQALRADRATPRSDFTQRILDCVLTRSGPAGTAAARAGSPGRAPEPASAEVALQERLAVTLRESVGATVVVRWYRRSLAAAAAFLLLIAGRYVSELPTDAHATLPNRSAWRPDDQYLKDQAFLNESVRRFGNNAQDLPFLRLFSVQARVAPAEGALEEGGSR